MESDRSPEDALATAERAAVAPWIDQPSPPWWLMPSYGLLMGVLVLTLGERATLPAVWYAIALVAIVFLIGAWIGAVIRYQGVYPRLRNAPPEFVPAVRGYFIGCALFLALVVTVYFAVGSRLAAVVAAVGWWIWLPMYEKRFATAADAVRRRVE